MKEVLTQRGMYFDAYKIYNKDGKLIGMYEDHCRGVKNQYFVAWANLQQKSYGLTGATESFYTKDEAISYTLSNQN